MKQYLVKKLGGFYGIDDAIEIILNEGFERRIEILTLAVKHNFNTIGKDDILKENKSGNWMCEGKILNEGQKKQIIAEAKTLNEMLLWDLLQKDISFQANRQMFLNAKNETEMTAGKLWLYTLDAIRTRLKSIAKGSGSFNKGRVPASES